MNLQMLNLLPLIALAPVIAHAGVVVTERETGPDGAGGTKTSMRTTYIAASQQKTVTDASSMLIDLDKGTMTWLDTNAKTARVMPLDSNNPMLQSIQGAAAGITYKATGTHKTVAGFSCDEYSSTGTMMSSEFSTRSCFAKDVPAAAEYSAFGLKMMQKSGMTASTKGLPPGILMASETTIRVGLPPGMPPEAVQMMAAQIAKQGPQVSRTEVTAIRSEALPAGTFLIPAGFTITKAP